MPSTGGFPELYILESHVTHLLGGGAIVFTDIPEFELTEYVHFLNWLDARQACD